MHDFANDSKKYIAYYDCGNLRTGCIDKICTCEKCKERGVAEVFINDLDGNWLDCVETNELKNIVYFGNSMASMINEIKKIIERTEKEKLYLQSLIEVCGKIG